MLIYGIISGLINAIAFCFFGIYLFWQNPKSRINQTAALVYLANGFWSLIYFLFHWQGIASGDPTRVLFWSKMTPLGFLPLGILFYHYILAFLDQEEKRKKSLLIGYLATIFCLFLSQHPFFISKVTPRWYLAFWPDPGWLFYPVMVLWLIYFIYSFYLLYFDYKKSEGLRRMQLRYMILGPAAGAFSGLLIFLSWLPYTKVVPPFSVIFMSSFVFLSFYGVIRYRLMDIRFVLGKTALYVCSFLTVLFFSLLFFIIGSFLSQSFYLGLLINAFLVSLLVFLFPKIFSFYEKLGSKYFYYTIYQARKSFSQISGQLAQILNFSQLKIIVSEILAEALRVEKVEFTLVGPAKDPLVRYLEKTHQPLVYEEIFSGAKKNNHQGSRELVLFKEKMKKEKIEICLPLFFQNKIIGLICLGRKITSEAYYKEEIDLLESFSYQVVVALRNTQLYGQLEEINLNLEKKVKERTRELGTIITSFTDGLLVFNNKNKLSLINPQAENILGIDGKKMIGKNLSEFSKINESLTKFANFLTSQAKDRSEKINGVAEIFRQEFTLKDELILEITTVPMKVGEDFFGILAVLHDVTREKMVERIKSEFVSLAAHQLRTPLAAVKWSLSMMLGGDAGRINREQKDFLRKSYLSNERMINLVNDLLSVTRIEEGRYLYQLSSTDLVKVTKRVIESYRNGIAKKKIKLIFKKTNQAIPLILADQEKIELVIQNLLENAIRYSPKGGQVTIWIKLAKMEVEFVIEDNGIGIPDNQRDRVFSKFFRADNAIKAETEGNGLGLYISQNIVRAHGGKIWFESQLGKGATFYLTLPIKK